ncbi:hypothetical protein DND47_20675 [Pseudomonas syringae pv. syringae]|nr:hypothetical protein DND47_20675 [Pseudomonas syringae pv. syringae]
MSGSSCCASVAARSGCRPVGASLLAKRPVQSAKIHRLINRIREQAGSTRTRLTLHTCIKRRTGRAL